MKKITILLSFLAITLGNSQTNLEDFEGAAPTVTDTGFTSTNVVANPDSSTGSGNESANVLELITNGAGNAWQEAEMVIQNNTIDMTTADKTLTIDIYSTNPVEYMIKLVDGDVGGSDVNQWSKTAAAHPGGGWATITFDFTVPADTTQPGYNPPNDKFGGIVFYPLYNIANNGWNTAADTTTYVDNITAIAGGTLPTCTDGIQNQDETGIDCGGPNCSPCGITAEIIEGFEGTAPTLTDTGFTSVQVVANPDSSAGSGNESANVLELITSAASNPWQEAEMVIQNNTIDMTTADKTLTIDIYSTNPVEYMIKLVAGEVGGDDNAQWSKTAAAHPGGGWATITFDFNVPADTSQPGYNPPNDKFGGIVFYPLYNIANNGWNTAADTTTYVDNITALPGGAVETCSDGIQNQDETGIDCGGVCGPCYDPPTTAAPTPPARADQDHVSMFSSAYTDQATSGFNVYDALHVVANYEGTGDTCLASTPNVAGNAFAYEYFGNGMDLENQDRMHVDLFLSSEAPAGAVWQAKILQSPVGTAGDNILTVSLNSMTPGVWNSFDIPFSNGSNGSLFVNNVEMVQIFAAGAVNGYTLYMDNLYFHNDTPLGLDDFDIADFKVFPNPSNDNWNISGNTEITKVSVFDILGKEVMTLTPNRNEAIIEASNLGTGIYFAKIEGVKGNKTLKLIRR